jgi:hypothetical protein
VNSPAATTRRSDSTGKLVRGCAILTAVEIAAFLSIGAILSQSHGANGWIAAGIAAGLCWIGSVGALILVAVAQGPSGVVNGVLLGMFARTGVPLAGGLAVSFGWPMLAEAGLMQAVFACYLMTLIVETGLSLRLVSGPRRAALSTLGAPPADAKQ